MIRPPKPCHGGKALLIISASVLSLFFLIFSDGFLAESKVFASDGVSVPFSDLPTNPLYAPAIETFQQQNIIIGDTLGGEPTGKLRPKDYLMRAEFTKVATMIHLLESVQSGELEGKLSEYLDISLNDFIFKTDYLLRPYYSAKPGAPHFSDVPDKDLTCAKDPGGCEPWYTQYVNYMASLGTIKGTGNNMFSPNDTLLRIHALKMVMVEDGTVPAEEDGKFRRLEDDERVKNRSPRCLVGAEDYILANNGGNTQDSQNLLAYALLADKLDIFGNRCQFFAEKSANTPSARAELLQKPLTRQEVARFFALTTTIPELQLDPASDSTVDSKNEYIAPVDTEVKEDKVLEAEVKLKSGQEKTKNDDANGEEAGGEEETGPPYGKHPLTPEDLLKYFSGGDIPTKTEVNMPFDLKLAISKTGRCCKTKDLYPESNCKIITYADYAIGEENDYNWATYDGPVWHKAERFGESCWIPLPDIMNGYSKESAEATKEEGGYTEKKTATVTLKKSVLSEQAGFSELCGITMSCMNPVEILMPPSFAPKEKLMSEVKPNNCNSEIMSCATAADLRLMERAGTDYWYTVIPGWQTVSDGLWGGVFSKKRYSKEFITDTLFPQSEGNKYKEIIVKAIGRAESYDGSDPYASANKKAMIKNYRTDRWYKIYYTNPAKPGEGEKTGWVPVSSLVEKNSIFVITDTNGNYLYKNFNCGYSNIPGSNKSVDQYDDKNSPVSPVDKLLLHNTAGYSADTNVCANYTLGGKWDSTYKNKLVAIVPEYSTSGTLGSNNGFKPATIERKTVSVEIANIEWVNISQDSDVMEVIDGVFHNFDFEKLKGDYDVSKTENTDHYVEITGDRYTLARNYFDEKEGGFNSDFKQLKKDKEVFDRFFYHDSSKSKYKLRSSTNPDFDSKIHIDALSLVESNSDSNQLLPLYKILNKIPFDYSFYTHRQKGTEPFKGDIKDIVYARDTMPYNAYIAEDSVSEQMINFSADLKKKYEAEGVIKNISSYYQKYTDGQYRNLNTFMSMMNQKYGIPLKTFSYNLPDIPDHYAFYYAQTARKWKVYDPNDNYGRLLSSLIQFKGIISHHNQTFTGKMCPAPGFSSDRITVLSNQ